MPLGVPEGHPGGPWGDHMLPKSIKTNVFLIIEKNTKAYRYENIYKKAAKLLQTLNLPNMEREARLVMERCGIKKQRVWKRKEKIER